VIPAGYSHLQFLVERQLSAFPEHQPYLEKRFSGLNQDALIFADEIADKIAQIAGEQVDHVCADYSWLSQAVLAEELHFRRSGKYRLSTFVEAEKQVYSDPEFMTRYMNGLLISQLWWRNHTESLHFFREEFVARNPAGVAHLEIGPGHGLLLYLASSSPTCGFAQAWDVSDISLIQTQRALTAMRMERWVTLKKMNLYAAPRDQFGSIVFSEVLEHMEQPQSALRALHELLTDDGRMFLNAPVNSPAPDHLYLFATPEELLSMIVDAGFQIESSRLYPATGATLQRARKLRLTISVNVIVRKR
jgi:2-polyprenyl-3-methyl-5-hydroxy-6-metoxy-1,4-benzoquinol methylase